MDLPWNGMQELVGYIIEDKYQTAKSLEDELKNKYDGEFPADWLEDDTQEIREALLKLANPINNGKSKSAWFKRIDHGQYLGNVIFECFDDMDADKHLKKMFIELSKWIDA